MFATQSVIIFIDVHIPDFFCIFAIGSTKKSRKYTGKGYALTANIIEKYILKENYETLKTIHSTYIKIIIIAGRSHVYKL